MPRRAMLRFAFTAFFIYGVLTLAWPGFEHFYAAWFRSLIRGFLGGVSGTREVMVVATPSTPEIIRLEIINHALLSPSGTGPVRDLDLHAHSFWRTTALFLSLALLTPGRWWMQPLFAGVGFAIMQAFCVATVAFGIWNEGRHLDLSQPSPGLAAVADRFQSVWPNELSLAVPVLVWLTGWYLLTRFKISR